MFLTNFLGINRTMTSSGRIILSSLTIQVMILLQSCFDQRDISDEVIMDVQPVTLSPSIKGDLLFYLSGKNGFTGNISAGGRKNANFLKHISVIAQRAYGKVSGLRTELKKIYDKQAYCRTLPE